MEDEPDVAASDIGADVNQHQNPRDEQGHEEIAPEWNGVRWHHMVQIGEQKSESRKK